MNAVYAKGWYSVSAEEIYTSLGHYSRLYWNGFYLEWDRADCRYVVR
jgi:hypothetical protein